MVTSPNYPLNYIIDSRESSLGYKTYIRYYVGAAMENPEYEFSKVAKGR